MDIFQGGNFRERQIDREINYIKKQNSEVMAAFNRLIAPVTGSEELKALAESVFGKKATLCDPELDKGRGGPLPADLVNASNELSERLSKIPFRGAQSKEDLARVQQHLSLFQETPAVAVR